MDNIKPICILGVIGSIILLFAIIKFCFRAVSRDQLLGRGKFILFVIISVILIPISITGIIEVFNFISSTNIENTTLYNNVEIGNSEEHSILWAVYYHFIDPGNQHNATHTHGRWIVGIIAMLGVIFLNGLLITTLINWFQQRQERWRNGEIRYNKGWLNSDRKLNNYTVIIGGNKMVAGIIGQIADKEEYIIVLTRRNADEFRRELHSILPQEYHEKLIIYYGDCTSEEEIKNLQLENAKEVYILGEPTDESDNNSYHDTVNMRCFILVNNYFKGTPRAINLALKIDEINKKIKEKKREITNVEENIKQLEKECPKDENAINEKTKDISNLEKEKDDLENKLELFFDKRLTCRVMFEHQTTFSAYQFTDIDKEMIKYINFRPFNYYETWAQQVMVNYELEPPQKIEYLPLDGYSGITKGSEDFVHLIIVGMSRMGYAMAIEAAHLAHYPNFIDKKKRTRITFIDPKAKEEMTLFTNRFKELFALSRSRYVEAQEQGVLYDGVAKNLYSDTEGWFDPLTDPNSTSPYKGDYLGIDFIDIEWEFIQGSIQWQEIQQYLEDATKAPHSRATIALCQPNNNEAVAAAIYMNSTVLENAQQILVYQRNGTSIIDSLAKGNSPYKKLKPFGMEKDCFNINSTNIQEKIAKILQKAYDKQYEKTKKEEKEKLEEMQKNESIEIEKETEEEKNQREKNKPLKYDKSNIAKEWSNLYNANTMWSKLRSIDFKNYPNNIVYYKDILRVVEHNRWNVEQLLLRFQPLTHTEQKEITKDYKYTIGDPFDYRKGCYKGIMKLLDICSCERLNSIDPLVCPYDEILTQILPQCYNEIKPKIKENKNGKELSTQSH